MLKHECHTGTDIFLNNLFSFGLYPVIHRPSRITSYTSTLIDNILTNDVNRKLFSGLVISDVTDHLPIFCIAISENKNEKCFTQKTSKYTINDKTIGKLKNDLSNIDWSNNIMLNSDVNSAYNVFTNIINNAFVKNCPVKVISKTEKNIPMKPWINQTLLNCCKKKNTLYRKYLKCKSAQALQRYKLYKNNLTSLLRKAEKVYYSNKLQQYKGDMKETWRILNSFIKKRNQQPKISGYHDKNNTFLHSDKDIANGFNNFFVNIGPDLAEKIPKCNDKHHSDYITKHVSDSIFLEPIVEQELLNVVKSFDNKFSSGYDNINMYLVKKIIVNISKPLVYLYNLSFSEGIFPDSMKLAKVLPLYKTDDPTSFSNYRPVSLLSQFSKILEKLFNNRLMKFIDKNNVLFEGQYGFRQNHSTELAVIEMTEKITKSLDEKHYSVGIFVDLKKAFDTINHNILIEKLSYYGIRGLALNWISSYLNNRSQYVCYNNVNSDLKNITCGIPQGSILGPSLFILYINDLCNVSDILKFILFADDTNIFCHGNDLKALENIINSELSHVNTWFSANQLSLNIKKTKYIIFGHKIVHAKILAYI